MTDEFQPLMLSPREVRARLVASLNSSRPLPQPPFCPLDARTANRDFMRAQLRLLRTRERVIEMLLRHPGSTEKKLSLAIEEFFDAGFIAHPVVDDGPYLRWSPVIDLGPDGHPMLIEIEPRFIPPRLVPSHPEPPVRVAKRIARAR